jgi:hypothetical protein
MHLESLNLRLHFLLWCTEGQVAKPFAWILAGRADKVVIWCLHCRVPSFCKERGRMGHPQC